MNTINIITAVQMATTALLVHDLLTLHQFSLSVIRNRYLQKQRLSNQIRSRECVISFIHLWDDVMFKRQFRLTRTSFWHLHNMLLLYKWENHDYYIQKHYKYAIRSSGSPVTLELQLYITIRLLSGASYLECIWYRVQSNSVYYIFWKTICLIDLALKNLTLPTDNGGVARMVESWAVKREIRHHGFAFTSGSFIM
jgi:hypothetical protein